MLVQNVPEKVFWAESVGRGGKIKVFSEGASHTNHKESWMKVKEDVKSEVGGVRRGRGKRRKVWRCRGWQGKMQRMERDR
jgi:hypothetical protein